MLHLYLNVNQFSSPEGIFFKSPVKFNKLFLILTEVNGVRITSLQQK